MANNTKVVGNENLKTFYNDLKQFFPQYIETTWQELKVLRNNNKLIKGATYRITDYTTTTTQIDTQSAQHNFDILVVADDINILNENAHAIKHRGDTYFANSKLQAWELKYCFDNDATRFAWSSSTGKGVIYYMKDEFNNEAPYDFKNIQFKRYKVKDTSPNSGLAELIANCPYLGTAEEQQSEGLTIVDTEDFIWAYTFTKYDETNNLISEASIYGKTLFNSEYGAMYGCYDNKIQSTNVSIDIDEGGMERCIRLNNIVFFTNGFKNQSAQSDASIICFDNTFGGDCYGMTVLQAFVNNTFGNNCRLNTFGNNCGSNIFGNDCYLNTFGNNCGSNTFGNNCGLNIFGNNCGSNIFGNDCRLNIFGNDCGSNIFGNDCYLNIFGNDCGSNTFGNDCYLNTFGNNCGSNTLSENANTNEIKSYATQNTLEQGVSYVILDSDDSESGVNYLQNLTIHKGVKGTASARKNIKVDRNIQNSVDIYAPNSKTIIL